MFILPKTLFWVTSSFVVDTLPNRLVRLKPCWMMSPLAVSTDLESPEFPFDVVIFDEVSQVHPWDAIGAVYRGRQLVVAGDQKQLPPSTFFDRMVNDDDSEDVADLGNFESVLDVCVRLDCRESGCGGMTAVGANRLGERQHQEYPATEFTSVVQRLLHYSHTSANK